MLTTGEVVALDGTYPMFRSRPGPAGLSAYEPIPGLDDILERVVDGFTGTQSLTIAGKVTELRNSLVVNIGRGLRCRGEMVRLASRRLHEGIVESLNL